MKGLRDGWREAPTLEGSAVPWERRRGALLGNVFTFSLSAAVAAGRWMGLSCVTSGRLLYVSEPWSLHLNPRQ